MCHYDWNRFWCPRGDTIQVTNEGYLTDPESSLGRFSNKQIVPLTSLLARPCLVLLGEAGIGKSTELRTLRAAPGAGVAPCSLEIDLGAYGDEISLRRDFFESAVFQDWKCGGDTLTVVLDSLDEALLEMPRIKSALERGLRGVPIERLRLRIASRTAAWPETLTGSLEEIFGEDQVGLYELTPLRRNDIELAANVEQLDAEEFLAQVECRGAGPLAANPTTLRLLLSLFGERRELPTSLVDLYERGLTILCAPNEERQDRNRPAPLSPPQILQMASRIAAMTSLTRNATIFTGLDSDAPPNDVAESAIVGGEEEADSTRFAVTPSIVRLALAETGLFTSRGPHRLGFAHKTYGEYLAARYLHRSRVPTAQIRSLLYVPDEDPPRLIPQLHEVAAWLASLDDEFFDETARIEPEVLLLSDVSARQADAKTRLVTRLFDRVERAELSWGQIRGLRPHFHRLARDGLAAQLKAIIFDSQRRSETRRLAIEIADATRQDELADEIADIALDPSLEYVLRDTAAHAVVNLEVASACQKLKPLALGQAGDDPDDQLKGCGLIAAWPESLTTEELVQCLTRPKRSNLAGAYSLFLISGKIADTIDVAGLPTALEWAVSLQTHADPVDSLSRLAGQLAYRALDDLDDPAISPPLAKLILKRLNAGTRGVFIPTGEQDSLGKPGSEEKELPIDNEQRRLLLGLLVAHLDSPNDTTYVLFGDIQLVKSDDIAWFFEQADSAEDDESRKWARLTMSLFNRANREHVELWLRYKRTCPAIAEIMAWPEQVVLGSTEARKMKAEYLKQQRWNKRLEKLRQAQPRLDPSAPERVRVALDRCLSGEPELFWWLLDQLSLEGEQIHHLGILPDTVIDHPGWKAADGPLRRQIAEAARRYLRDGKLEPDELSQRDDRYVADRAPALAVHLLLREDASFLACLDSSRWQSIGPYLLHAPVGNDQTRRQSAELAYPHASDAMRDAAIKIMERSKRRHEAFGVITALEDCLDSALASRVLEFLKRERCGPEQFCALLGWLLRHAAEGARDFAEALLKPPRFSADQWPRLCCESAVALIVWTDDAGWNVTWPLIENQPDAGGRVLQRIAHDFDRRSLDVAKKLTEEQLVRLMDWLLTHYPPAEDPRHEGAYRVGPEDSICRWRGALLHHLEGRGTVAACTAVRNLRDMHAECPWLYNVHLEAQRARRRESWVPPSPREFLELVRNASHRFIVSTAQLLDVIVESLDRYGEELHGTTPSVANLWNRLPDDKWRPKDENHLSDNIKRHLDRDLRERGVVVKREVEIRRRTGKGGASGQETDIYVNAVSRAGGSDTADVFTVVIEVKGCWHRAVRTAMKTQLVDRYLHENQCQHGLYVVGWFLCNAWDESDYREKNTPWLSLDAARQELEAQARVLCGELSPSGDVRVLLTDCTLR